MNSLRIKKLQKSISNNTVLFIAKPSDIRYFSGFEFLVPEEKESYLIISSTKAFLLHASFCPVTQQTNIDYFPGLHPSQLRSGLTKIISQTKAKNLLINKKHTTVFELELFSKYELIIGDLDQNKIDQLKTQKDKEEIKYIKKACQIAKEAFLKTKQKINTGQTEQDVQKLLEHEMEKLGSERVAFPTIVAFGENGALPHHQPTNKILENETPILMDFGAMFNGYRSDMTRSFWFGENPTKEFTKVEKIVKTAYHRALKQTQKDNIKIGEIDQAARNYIKEQGYGDKFIHTTGHGLGLDIHEPPSIYFRTDTILRNKTIFTIEPGIYLEGKFGFRYENTILFDSNNQKKTIELTL